VAERTEIILSQPAVAAKLLRCLGGRSGMGHCLWPKREGSIGASGYEAKSAMVAPARCVGDSYESVAEVRIPSMIYWSR
jgi:hypothetical protein